MSIRTHILLTYWYAIWWKGRLDIGIYLCNLHDWERFKTFITDTSKNYWFLIVFIVRFRKDNRQFCFNFIMCVFVVKPLETLENYVGLSNVNVNSIIG